MAGPEVERLYQPKLDRAVLGRLLQYARPYRGRIVWAVVLLLLVSAGELLFPLLTRQAIDAHIRTGDMPGLARISLLYLGILIAVFVLRYVQMVMTQTIGQKIMFDLRNALFGHLQGLDLRYFEKNPVGRIMTRLTGDVETLNELFTSGIISIFGDVVTLAGIAVVLFWLNWKLALVTLIVVPLLLTATLVFRAKVRRAYALIRIRIAAINAFLQENIAGISIIHLFHRHRIHEKKFDTLNADHRDAFLQSVYYFSLYFPVIELLESLALGLILWYGGGESVRGALTLGSLVAFIQYSERFFRPIRDISERYNILQGAMASSERIFEVLDTRATILSPGSGAFPGPQAEAVARGASGAAALVGARTAAGAAAAHRSGDGDEGGTPHAPIAVEFRDVRFSYVPGQEVLKGISFSVRRGESVALVGHTGAGKTTISSLLSRFYDIDSGGLFVEGRDVREWDLKALRRHIGIVPQEVFLWSGDLALNVGLRAGRTDGRVEEALRLVGADALARRLEAVLTAGSREADVGIGERGSQLSVGQRQLVAFARALAADPPILILDEATSSVDTETEQRLRRALLLLLRGRTSLVIAHRLSTIRHVDRILVLHRGVLVEEGTHDELIREGGIYARYYELEYRGQEAGSAPQV